ncbi:hypothetical protein Acsp04_30850 [Actinomadura sp. NBRC 104425]|uniref:hypothetical protein n=1 Tax=Actinomadura sp. NBRC 104425 TaxID=3032204 RepID=UPI0024A3F70C|nr:hypothetical protein [Actinomadura sp. NBRC 104425]GLZ12850.1 hypothetical protein Acsp04_30850 [Actinomadura sp. NBRC 104425]
MTETFGCERGAVPADHADREALEALAAARGWIRVDERPPGFFETGRQVWRAGDAVRVVYLESTELGARYVGAEGAAAEPVEEVFAAVAAVLPTVSADEVLAGLLAEPMPAPRDLVRGLNRLAAFDLPAVESGGRRPEDPRYRQVAERLAGHPDRQVRRALLSAAAGLAAVRPELAEPILARRGEETELAHLVDAVAAAVEARR